MPNWKEFKSFFIGNIHAYGLQNNNGKWTAVRERIKKDLLEKHLNQEITIGSYDIYRRSNNICCKWICIDLDLHPFKLENNIIIDSTDKIKDVSFPTRLKGRKSFFYTPQELEEYYWERSGLIVYEKVSKPTDKKQKTKEIWIGNVPYYFIEKYRIQANDKKKLEQLVLEIEVFLRKFYMIPKHAICREKSGRGYHIWINLADNTTLKRAWDFREDIKEKVLSFFGIDLDEIFPKQDDILDTYECPRCEKQVKVSVYERSKFIECPRCELDIELNTNNLKDIGLGNFVKLPFSINRNSNTICEILDRDFDLSNNSVFEITDLVKKIRKKDRIERKYDRNETELNLGKWKPLNKDDKYFFSKLRYCLKQIVKGRQAVGTHGHDMRICLANELFKLKAPVETRIRAFERQQDFEYEKTKYQVKDLEMRARRANRFFISKCSTIAKWGYCYRNCPMRYRAKDISEEEIAEILFGTDNEDYGIKGGWEAVRQLLNQKINGDSDSKDYIVKTTRSGTTTNVILETIESDKKLLMIAPTIRICDVTLQEALDLTDKKVNVFRLGSNKDLCLLLANRVNNVQALGRFPFLLKENCKKCQYAEMLSCNRHRKYNKECERCKEINKHREKCNWRRAIEDIQDYDIIYITIAKMYALTKTSDIEAQEILEKIYNNVDVIFLDEISNVLDVGSEGIIFKEKADEMYRELASEINFTDNFQNEFTTINPFMTSRLTQQQLQIWYALEDFIKGVENIHKNWATTHKNDEFHLLNSPLYDVIDNLNILYAEDEDLKGSGDGDWLSIYQYLIEYAEQTDHYPRHIVDLLILAKFPQFYIQYTSPLRYTYRMELLPAKPVREFIEFLNMLSAQKKFFTTDATEPPIDVSRMFPNIDELIINDPMDTARRQIVYPDNQSINISRIKALRFYLKDIREYIEKHGNPNTMIICQNIITARVLRKVPQIQKGKHYKHLTYFRSPLTIGTPSECRTIITIGSPYPPKNSHRWLADLFIKQELVDSEEFDIEGLTRHLEYYNAKSQFFQAISRGKDPKGKVKSAVYTYGLNKFQVVQLLRFPIAVPRVKD